MILFHMYAHLILYSVVFYIQMVDLTFNFEIHHGGQFVWNPDLVYLGDSTSFIDKVDPDKLSYFEIQHICSNVGAVNTSRFHYLILGGNLEQGLRLINGDDDVVYMCEIHDAWPIDKITLYVKGGEEPLVVEQPFGNEEVANVDDVMRHLKMVMMCMRWVRMMMMCIRCMGEVMWILKKVVDKILIGWRKGLRGQILMMMYLEM